MVVGADRIAANGDVANKIGTYGVAVLAKENGVPFYVAAPISTLDLTLKSGDEIPIEERNAREVTHVQGVHLAPEGIHVANPAFDVTPNRYVTAIITERGVARAPFTESLASFSGWAGCEIGLAEDVRCAHTSGCGGAAVCVGSVQSSRRRCAPGHIQYSSTVGDASYRRSSEKRNGSDVEH